MSRKIAFVGPPGSGKSTLAADVYTFLKQRHQNVEIVPEWIRYDIQAHGAMESIWEQYRTRQNQKDLEDAVPDTVDTVICDSATLTPYFYACLYCKHAEPRQRLVMQDMYRYLLDDLYGRRYDLVFYLPSVPGTDIEDGTRYQTAEEVRILERHMELAFCDVFRVGNVHRIDGPFAERLTKVVSIIEMSVGGAMGGTKRG
jgi:nicotinamide riboside kinase